MPKYGFLHSNQRGFTATELMISVGLLSLVSFGIGQAVVNFQTDLARMRIFSARSEIVSQIRNAGQDLRAYRNSTALAPSLEQCLDFSVNAPPCESKDQSSNAFVKKAFTLVSPLDANEILAGPESATGDHVPIYYDIDGRRCDGENNSPSQCPIQAIVSYTPLCHDEANTCSGARAIQLHYDIKLRPEANMTRHFAFRPASSTVMLDLQGGNYLRLFNASSAVGGSIDEVDMAKGKMLTVDTVEPIYATVMLRDSEPVDEIELKAYVLPANCDFTKIDSSSCARPPLNSYQLITKIPVDSGPSVGLYSKTFTVGNSGYAEVVAVSKYNGEYRRRSSTVLRLKAPSIPIVSATGPSTVIQDCSHPEGSAFAFRARDDAGLVSYNATVSPPLPGFPEGNLPDFTFNLEDPSPQSYFLTYNKFKPGTNYRITFKVKNSSGVSRQAVHQFYVDPLPAEEIQFNAPTAGAFLRRVDSLTVDTTVYLSCEKTLTSAALDVKSTTTTWMSPAALSCTSLTSSQPNRVAFQCTGTFSCNQWLGKVDCMNFDGYGTTAKLTATANPSDGPPISKTIDVQVDGYISVALNQPDTLFIIAKGDGIYSGGSNFTLPVVFSATLPTDVWLVFDYSTGDSKTIKCNKGSNKCNPSLPIPATGATITLKVGAASTDLLRTKTPDVATFIYDNRMESCATQEQPVVCDAGKTLKMSVTKVAHHDLSWGPGGATINNLVVKPNANVDFFITHRRNNPNNANEKLSFSVSVNHYDGHGQWLATTSTAPAVQASDVTSRVLFISDQYWRTRNFQSFFSSKFDVKAIGTGIEAALVRQCYCE